MLKKKKNFNYLPQNKRIQLKPKWSFYTDQLCNYVDIMKKNVMTNFRAPKCLIFENFLKPVSFEIKLFMTIHKKFQNTLQID